MSKKSELLKSVRGFKAAYAQMEQGINNKRQGGTYTAAGLDLEIQGLLAGAAGSIQGSHDTLIQLIDSGLEGLENQWKTATAGKLTDGGYQAGLANVLKMLELGAITEEADIRNVIDTYQGDYNALAVIQKMLLNSSDENTKYYASLVPKDTRHDSRRLLRQLKSNVDEYISVYTVEQALKGQSSLTMTLEGMETFVNDRLGDNLEVALIW